MRLYSAQCGSQRGVSVMRAPNLTYRYGLGGGDLSRPMARGSPHISLTSMRALMVIEAIVRSRVSIDERNKSHILTYDRMKR